MEIKGIDISSHQGETDFERVKAASVRFVIIKARQGLWEM
ncbi:GH25 family lysozyme [Anaerotruncus colihominis]